MDKGVRVVNRSREFIEKLEKVRWISLDAIIKSVIIFLRSYSPD